MKKNIFKYFSNIEEYQDIVVPSKINIPNWYKKLSLHINNSVLEMTAKKCLPFMESFTIGYQVVLPCDLYIDQPESGTSISWRIENFNMLSERSKDSVKGMSPPIGCSDKHFVWQFPAVFQIPKGYSALFTHPLNRNDLPFVTMSGVIDGEYVFSQNGNVPVFFSDSFQGIVPQGTPIAQIILFKSENWISEKDESLIKKSLINRKKSNLIFSDWYKINFWNKKTYE